MDRQKDIFSWFRERQHLLDEAPSAQAWRKLERRLETHQRRGRLVLYRSMAFAASLLLLIGVFSILSHSFNVTGKESQESLSGMPQQLELLSANETEESAFQLAAFSQTYRAKAGQTIEEGTSSKRLVAVEQ